MFWKFHLDSSGIDTLLAKQDVTLTEILDEEDVLQECKTQNGKLIDFLTKDEILKELLHLIVDEPPDDVDDAIKYKYPNLACEVLTLDIYTILDKVANDQECLDIIWSYAETPSPLNPLIASFFSKVITILICRKGQETFDYLKSHDAVNKLIVHIEISAIMELYIKLVTVVESQELRIEISRWLDDENLIEKLIQLLHPSEKEEKHYNASQLLSELVRIGRDTISQYVESEEDPLLLTLEKKETVEKLLSVMFEDVTQPNSDSTVVNGILTLSSMMEIKRPIIEGMEELITPMDVERIAQGVHTTLEVLSTRLQDFHDMLVQPHSKSMETTYGVLDPPLGKVRLNIAALIATAVATNTKVINEALAKTGTVNVLLDLFSRYEWNNFLHTYIQQCILAILSSETMFSEVEQNDVEYQTEPLLKHLFQECNIVQRCLTLWEGNEISQNSGSHRKGYMGHLTKIVNEIVHSKEKGPNYETIKSLYNELSDETRERWNDLVSGSLEEINKKNLCIPVNSLHHVFDSDSEGDDYRPISISQYEGTLQQAFENYQVQPMTNEFIESFGYDEDSLQQNENIKNPFDEVGNIDFAINANEESENEKLFESVCEQKIQPFDDSDESDEEDIWEEKQLTFSSPTQPRQSKNAVRSDSDSSSDEEDGKKDDCNTKAASSPYANNKEQEEKMEVDSEWTANFDQIGMDVQTGASDWASPAAAGATSLSSSGEAFADFTDISKFEISDNIESANSPPIAMETEGTQKTVASVYEVKMEEDNPPSPAVVIDASDDAEKNVSQITLSEKSDLSLDLPPDSNPSEHYDKMGKGNSSPSKLTSITVKSIRSPSKPQQPQVEVESSANENLAINVNYCDATRKEIDSRNDIKLTAEEVTNNNQDDTTKQESNKSSKCSSTEKIGAELKTEKVHALVNTESTKSSEMVTNGPVSSQDDDSSSENPLT